MRKRNDEVMVDMAPGPIAMAPQHRPRIWLEFDDGSAVGVRGAGLLGRDPAPATGDRFEHLITLAEDTLSVSRTHLEFGTGESGLWIRGRSCTNGSVSRLTATAPPSHQECVFRSGGLHDPYRCSPLHGSCATVHRPPTQSRKASPP